VDSWNTGGLVQKMKLVKPELVVRYRDVKTGKFVSKWSLAETAKNTTKAVRKQKTA